ncbi:MAG TPA: hypothetical protein VL625_04605 [Patescibacteria group bacterium]|nr:hypothetical protein [Patescibacteria group bacterium]
MDLKALESLKSFDWKSLRKYASPQAADDLNRFLENLPKYAGKTALMAGGIAWAFALTIGLFAFIEMKDLTKLRADLADVKALQPVVPKLKAIPVSPSDVKAFAATLAHIYSDVEIKSNGSEIQISSRSTSNFGEWREAVGHVQNGGSGWRISINKMCVGRECKAGGNQLDIVLKISKVSVDKPD